jgi:lipoate-protein ligase A
VTLSHPPDWLLLVSGPQNYAFNMALDEALLEAMPRLCQPVLRFYGWVEKAASLGYFQKYAQIERLTLLRPLVRRPTAGGLVPHDHDWTYSLAFPTSHPWYSLAALESYRRVHEWLQTAFSQLAVPAELAPAAHKAGPGQCFLGHDQFDLLWRGQKIAGAAQRRTRNGLLIQGSIQPPPLPLSRADWQNAMCQTAQTNHGVTWTDFAPDTPLRQRALDLAQQKYSQPAYNQKR